jgi:phosphoadenosine phosphosulfate reductase
MSAFDLYARRQPGFEARLSATVTQLHDAALRHTGRIVQATSLGAEDMVITDLIARHRLGIAVATLDTGKLHSQTLELMQRLEQHYAPHGLTLARFAPEPQEARIFVQRHGERAMFDSIALRKACCQVRKMEPLSRLLAGRSAWVTGLRREQSDGRAQVLSEEDDGQCRTKFNPLAQWTWSDVWHYIQANGVPYNPLHDAFFPSIGCEPCTRAIAVGEPFRAGRWWWEDEAAKECGLHVKPDVQPLPEKETTA